MDTTQQPICYTHDIEDRRARGFSTTQGDILITQRDGSFYAYVNSCPHLGTQLEYQEDDFLDADHEYIICSTHGALFQVDDGQCIFGPCMGDHLTPIAIEVHSDGGIYLVIP